MIFRGTQAKTYNRSHTNHPCTGMRICSHYRRVTARIWLCTYARRRSCSLWNSPGCSLDTGDFGMLGGRMYVPEARREEVLKEFHGSRFAVHPGGNKMYRDIQRQYGWQRMM